MRKIESRILENGLLLQVYSGGLTKSDLAEYFFNLYKNPEYLNVSVIFSDFRNAQVALIDEDLIEVAHFILTYAPKVQQVKNAILVTHPKITAYSFLYMEVMKEMPLYRCEVFSTFSEAANFIGFDINQLKDLLSSSFNNDEI